VSVDFCGGDRGERSNGLDNFLLGGCALWRSGIEATEFAGVVARNGDYLARIGRQGEMRWRDLERMYFGSYEIHAHYIPLGTFHRLKLVSTLGQKVSLGERIGGADSLGREIAKFTLKPLLEKALQSFENGQEVEFGKIIVSRNKGVTVRTWYDDKRIAWQEIESYACNDAYFKIHRFKKHFAVSISSEKIANAHVLHALLDGVMRQVWQRGPSSGEGR